MWPYPWTHVGTPSHLGHMDRVAATMPSQAHAGAAQEAPDIGQWEGQDVPLVRPSSCNVKGGIPSSRRYLPTYLFPSLVLRVLSLHRPLFILSLLFLAAAASSSSWIPGRSHPGPPRPWMFQSGCSASPVVPVRVPCVRPLLLLLLLLPLPDSCSLRPSFPLALVHDLLAVSCRRRFLILMEPRTLQPRVASRSDVPLRVRCFPGLFSPGSMCLAAFPPSPSSPASRLFFFASFLICSLLLFMFSSPLLSVTISPSFCSPGSSNPGPLCPRSFQSRPPPPRMFQSECLSSPDVPVRAPCACLPLLLLLHLPLPVSCSSCPLFPPTLFLALFFFGHGGPPPKTMH